jgi:hypothetical protein
MDSLQIPLQRKLVVLNNFPDSAGRGELNGAKWMGTMNDVLIFVSNVIHTSTRYSLDSTDVALETERLAL